MSSMTYCRHENTAAEMRQVVDMWEYDPADLNDYERRARERIVALAHRIVELAAESEDADELPQDGSEV